MAQVAASVSSPIEGDEDKVIGYARRATLLSISRDIGLQCRAQNLEFLRCKADSTDPEACLAAGTAVTKCAESTYEIGRAHV